MSGHSNENDLLQYIAKEVSEIRRENRERDERRSTEIAGLRVELEKMKGQNAVERVKHGLLSALAGALGGQAHLLTRGLPKLF